VERKVDGWARKYPKMPFLRRQIGKGIFGCQGVQF